MDGTTINLTWDPSSDDHGIDRYEVYRTDLGTSTPLGSSLTPSYADIGRTPDTAYEYRVRAVDTMDQNSGLSDPFSLTTPVDELPSVPANLSGSVDVDGTTINLTWDPSSDDHGIDRYEVFRTDLGTSTPLGSSLTPSYADIGRTPDTAYEYRVRAVDTMDQNSGLSDPFSLTTPVDELPSVPANLSGSVDVDGTTINLTWDPSSDDHGIDRYEVFRTDLGTSTPLGSSLTPSYADIGRTPDTAYEYRVRAVDTMDQNSGLSDPFSLTTPVSPPPSFADDFESGTLAAWTSSASMAVEPSVGFGGSQGARAHPNGAAAFAQKQLAGASSIVTFHTRFNIASQGANWIELIKFRSAGGGTIATVAVDRTDLLLLRIPGTSTTIISPRVASIGAWHELVLKVTISGTSGTSEVWLDGVQVPELSVTANFGTAQIATVQLGDSSSRTYDIAYDDVAVWS